MQIEVADFMVWITKVIVKQLNENMELFNDFKMHLSNNELYDTLEVEGCLLNELKKKMKKL